MTGISAPAKAVAMTVLVLLLDHSMKLALRHEVAQCEDVRLSACEHVAIGPWLRLVSTENAGSVFGFLQGLDLWLALAGVSLLLIPLYGRRLDWRHRVTPIAIGMQAGGATSNLLDRLVAGSVVDYVAISGAPLVVNLADVALVCGALLAARQLRRVMAGTTAEPALSHVLRRCDLSDVLPRIRG